MPTFIDPQGRVVYHGKLTPEEEKEWFEILSRTLLPGDGAQASPGESPPDPAPTPSLTLEQLAEPRLCTVCVQVAAITRRVGKLVFLQRCACMQEEASYGAVPGFKPWFCRCCARLLPDEARDGGSLYCNECDAFIRIVANEMGVPLPAMLRFDFRAHRHRLGNQPHRRYLESPRLTDLEEADRLERILCTEALARRWMRERLRTQLAQAAPSDTPFIPLAGWRAGPRLSDEERDQLVQRFLSWIRARMSGEVGPGGGSPQTGGGDSHAA
jgi:hypothetical protein